MYIFCDCYTICALFTINNTILIVDVDIDVIIIVVATNVYRHHATQLKAVHVFCTISLRNGFIVAIININLIAALIRFTIITIAFYIMSYSVAYIYVFTNVVAVLYMYRCL